MCWQNIVVEGRVGRSRRKESENKGQPKKGGGERTQGQGVDAGCHTDCVYLLLINVAMLGWISYDQLGGEHLQAGQYVGSSGWALQMQLVGVVMSSAMCVRVCVCIYVCDPPETLP